MKTLKSTLCILILLNNLALHSQDETINWKSLSLRFGAGVSTDVSRGYCFSNEFNLPLQSWLSISSGITYSNTNSTEYADIFVKNNGSDRIPTIQTGYIGKPANLKELDGLMITSFDINVLVSPFDFDNHLHRHKIKLGVGYGFKHYLRSFSQYGINDQGIYQLNILNQKLNSSFDPNFILQYEFLYNNRYCIGLDASVIGYDGDSFSAIKAFVGFRF